MIYLFGLLGVLVMIAGVYITGHSNGADAQEREDQPKIATAQANEQIAVAKNAELISERVTIKRNIEFCNQATAAAKADTAISDAKIEKLMRESAVRAEALAGLQSRFDAAARTKQPVAAALSCEAARSALADYADHARAADALGLGDVDVTIKRLEPKPK